MFNLGWCLLNVVFASILTVIYHISYIIILLTREISQAIQLFIARECQLGRLSPEPQRCSFAALLAPSPPARREIIGSAVIRWWFWYILIVLSRMKPEHLNDPNLDALCIYSIHFNPASQWIPSSSWPTSSSAWSRASRSSDTSALGESALKR